MKMKQIIDSTIKITIQLEDLEERGMEMADFLVPQEKTEEFFASLGAPIRFKDVSLDESVIEALVEGLGRHEKIHLSEHHNLELEDARIIYQTAL